jgi:hypothetical protein
MSASVNNNNLAIFIMIKSEIKLLFHEKMIISYNWDEFVSRLESAHKEGLGTEQIRASLECYAPRLLSQLGDIIKKAIDLQDDIRRVFTSLLTEIQLADLELLVLQSEIIQNKITLQKRELFPKSITL